VSNGVAKLEFSTTIGLTRNLRHKILPTTGGASIENNVLQSVRYKLLSHTKNLRNFSLVARYQSALITFAYRHDSMLER